MVCSPAQAICSNRALSYMSGDFVENGAVKGVEIPLSHNVLTAKLINTCSSSLSRSLKLPCDCCRERNGKFLSLVWPGVTGVCMVLKSMFKWGFLNSSHLPTLLLRYIELHPVFLVVSMGLGNDCCWSRYDVVFTVKRDCSNVLVASICCTIMSRCISSAVWVACNRLICWWRDSSDNKWCSMRWMANNSLVRMVIKKDIKTQRRRRIDVIMQKSIWV